MHSEIRYAKSGNVSIAYQVVGDGPVDLLFVPGFVSHAEAAWEEPRLARFMRRLASFSRFITFDKRGTGMADPVTSLPTQEERLDDIRAVMDATGSRRAALFGVSEGGTMSILFAATYPERAVALVTFGAFARVLNAPDYPIGWTEEAFQRSLADVEATWAEGAAMRNPTIRGDDPYRRWFTHYLRLSASPGMVRALMEMNARVDIRAVLPSLRLPVLILHRTDHWPWIGTSDRILDEVEEFLTGAPAKIARHRVRGPESLTSREREVARMAALGWTAPRIGTVLFISERTVETHLANAYAKLGLESKLELVRRAAELDL